MFLIFLVIFLDQIFLDLPPQLTSAAQICGAVCSIGAALRKGSGLRSVCGWPCGSLSAQKV